MVEQYLVPSRIIFSWLLLELQVKVARSLHSWVKYSWSELQPTNIFPPENYQLYGSKDLHVRFVLHPNLQH